MRAKAPDREAMRRGFSLIELITVVAVIGVLAAVAGVLIVEPFQGAVAQRRRAELVDEAQITLELMAQDIRQALPNSVRVNGDQDAIEVVSTLTGGRYRRLPASGGGGNTLNRALSSDTFDVVGGLPRIGNVDDTGVAGTDCANDANPGDCINIFNTGQTGFNVYDDADNDGDKDNLARITKTDNAQPPNNSDQLKYDTGGTSPAFNAHSPRQRFFVVDDVVSFICADGSNDLNRHAGYGLTENQQVPPTGGRTDLVARDVTGCTFTFQPGTSSRAGLVTLDIAIQREGETVRLLKQIHVQNAP